jgi:hypothetical protein
MTRGHDPGLARVYRGSCFLLTIFSWPWPAMLAAAAGFGLVTFLLAVLALRLFHRSLGAKPTALPVAPFFTAVTTVWALSFGFTAADIWSANARAAQAASAERSSLTRLAGTAHRDALDLPVIVDGLRAYKRAVEEQEWGPSANGAPASGAELALQHIRLGIVDAAKAGAVEVLVGKMVQDFDELQDARNAASPSGVARTASTSGIWSSS